MFGEFVEARAGEAGRKRWAIAVSALCQTGTLLVLLLAPLLYTDALPNPLASIKALFVPVMPVVEAPKPPEVAVRPARPMKVFFDTGVLHAPSFIPPTVEIFVEPPLPPELPAGATGPGLLGTDLFNYLTTSRGEAQPPSPPVAPTLPQRIRQSQIQPAMILSQPQPAYPPLPRSVGIQGDVILHAIIDREGRVAELEVVSGHPMLAKAALDAVRTWRYRPTLLNGEPVEVETTIKVSFVLGR